MSGRILIAHELATTRIMLKAQLSAAAFSVDYADTEASLLSLVKRGAPDLLVLDCDFAGGRGLRLCQDLRQRADTRNTPIIMTDSFCGTLRLDALRAGADEVFNNPAQDRTFLARVRNLLRTYGLIEEMAFRQSTDLALGVAEAPAPFQRQGRILVSAGEQEHQLSLADHMVQHRKTHVEKVAISNILGWLAESSGNRPDAVLMAADAVDILATIPDLRSRPESRHAALLVMHETADQDTAARALDLGADDVVPYNCTVEEIQLRLDRQLDRKLAADELRNRVSRSLELAVIDPLTGLYNRRYALPYLSRIADKSARQKRPFAVLMIDLDRFKSVNDLYGHSVGDKALKCVADCLREGLRPSDLAARIGGEEFLVVLPETNWPDACATAERLRKVIESSEVPLPGRAYPLHLTASIGVARGDTGLQTPDPGRAAAMIDLADRALRHAKSGGRNQVIHAAGSA